MDQLKDLINADPLKSWWPFILSSIVGLAITIRNYAGGKQYLGKPNIRGRWFIVTGANGGIGREVCKELATRGANIILACRTLDSGTNNFVRYLRKRFPNSQFAPMKMDLASFESIRNFVCEIEKTHSDTGIDGLINQAGIMFNPFELSEDGLEMHLQCNYLGHLLLTTLLLPLINKSGQGRIVNVSAHAHSAGRIQLDDPLNIDSIAVSGAETFHSRDAFSHSKLSIILATRYMAQQLEKTKITVNCCSPGLVRGTGHFKRSPIMKAMCAKVLTYPWMWLFMRSPNQGAQTIVYLAIEPSVSSITGEYFSDCERSEATSPNEEKLTKSLMEASFRAIQVSTIQL